MFRKKKKNIKNILNDKNKNKYLYIHALCILSSMSYKSNHGKLPKLATQGCKYILGQQIKVIMPYNKILFTYLSIKRKRIIVIF